jgi:Ca2+-binding EF-hand superfamily protein
MNVSDINTVLLNAAYLKDIVGVKDEDIETLFKAMDTDNNGLIDTLELMIVLAALSGMDTVDKIYFVFNAYDFDGKGSLSYNELALLLQSAVSGLVKAFPTQRVFTSISNADAESYAKLVFGDKPASGRLSIADFRSYFSTHPVISSFFKYFASITPLQLIDDTRVTTGYDAADLPIYLSVDTYTPIIARAKRPAKMAVSVSPLDFVPPGKDHYSTYGPPPPYALIGIHFC